MQPKLPSGERVPTIDTILECFRHTDGQAEERTNRRNCYVLYLRI